MNTKFTRNDDDDEDGEDFPNPKKVQYYKRAIPSFEMIVNLNDSIRDPGHYFDLVEEMESLTENDIVRSDAVRQFIVALVRDEKKGQV